MQNHDDASHPPRRRYRDIDLADVIDTPIAAPATWRDGARASDTAPAIGVGLFRTMSATGPAMRISVRIPAMSRGRRKEPRGHERAKC